MLYSDFYVFNREFLSKIKEHTLLILRNNLTKTGSNPGNLYARIMLKNMDDAQFGEKFCLK